LSSEAALTLPIDAPTPLATPKLVELPKRKHSMLPLLTVLFLLSYGLMVLLVIEQNRTITSQRWLISELMSDSKELTSLKSKMLIERRNAEKPAAPKSESQSQSQSQSPSAQAVPQSKSKTRRNTLERPPKLTSDTPDVRRAVNMI
jgi:hypothetical protein